ncbi:oligosaccharide flippase family protein [Butyrivibrio sp. XBB1001]|uniref:oligosaccharide flippase family protein n=1 Tax=Butyrivibrio sp. XBB1001 TaxID=1280682 RepID=UPI00041BF506|nr:oligosaccharide flippase family protein [Butyrivibrio sp. XBB1001]
MIKNLLKKKAVLFTFLSSVASGINYISLIIYGRVFNVEQYANIMAFQSFLSMVATLMIPIQIMVCKEVAKDKGCSSKASDAVSLALLLSVIESVLLLVCAVNIMHYLDLVSYLEYVLFVILVFVNNIYNVIIGIVQGRQDFSFLGWLSIALYSLRLAISVLLGYLGIGPMAVIIGFGLAEIVLIFVLIPKISNSWTVSSVIGFKFEKARICDYLFLLVLNGIVSLYMNGGDILLGKMYSFQKELGFYSVASNLAKISIFLIASPISTVLLPKVVACGDNVKKQYNYFFISEGITCVISMLYSGLLLLLSKDIIAVLYGNNYSGAGEYIIPNVVFSITLGMFFVFYQFVIAKDMIKVFTFVSATIGLVLIILVVAIRVKLMTIPLIMSGAMFFSITVILFVEGIKKHNRFTITN